MDKKLINNITNKSIIFISWMTLPLNIIIYIALKQSEHLWPRFVIPIFSIVVVLMAIFRKKIPQQTKIIIFDILLFLSAIFSALLGLLDIASLWFVLSIIYTLMVAHYKKAIYVFVSGLVVIAIMGSLMIAKIGFLPLNYNFQNCQYACVVTRVLHYIIVGVLVYNIIHTFIKTIQANIKSLQSRSLDLASTNEKLLKEIDEKKRIQAEIIDTIILTEERERKRIAADLHDGLGPVLSSINLYYQAYIFEKDNAKKKQIEKNLKQIIQSASADISRISHNISPYILEKSGLFVALENFIHNLKTNINIRFDYEPIPRFDIKKELNLYRAVIELINNTIKHADAQHVVIKISTINHQLTISYSDDGIGFIPTEKHFGLGLYSIQNRMKSLQGNFIITQNKSKGFMAQINIPI